MKGAVCLFVGAGGWGTFTTVTLGCPSPWDFPPAPKGHSGRPPSTFGGGQAGAAGEIMNTGGSAGGMLAQILHAAHRAPFRMEGLLMFRQLRGAARRGVHGSSLRFFLDVGARVKDK